MFYFNTFAAEWISDETLPVVRDQWYMNMGTLQKGKCIWIYDLEGVRHLLEHQDKSVQLWVDCKEESLCLTFANAIYLKISRPFYVKTQIELEVWANCSGNKK